MSFKVQLRKNGPYIVEGQFTLADGALQSEQRVALCRCGESKNKPLCDGAHKQINFESEDCGQAGKSQNYDGEKFTVSYDPVICIHAGECVQGAPSVFDYEAAVANKPWIKPNAGTAADIKAIVARCPSGALRYTSADEKDQELPDAASSVQVTQNGPYFLRGNVEIVTADGEKAGDEVRVALCRCGQSKNKPFCDNSHQKVGFKAP